MSNFTVQLLQKTIKSSFDPVPNGLLQRKCACGQHTTAGGECAACQKQRLSIQRQATNQTEPATVPPIVHEVLRSPSQPLDPTTRAFMEPRFDHNFSQVRVHTDAKAAESARAVNALAYTVGHDVVFGAGQYATGTSQGKQLIAHELAHVSQQGGDSHPSTINAVITSPGDAFEHEAEAAAERVANGNISETIMLTSAPAVLQRVERIPIELSEAELQAEIERLESELDLTSVADPRWSELVDRIRALRQEQTDRLLSVRYTAVPSLEILSPLHDDIFYIDATPRMPDIACRARIRGITPDPTPAIPFDWQLTSVETIQQAGCPSSRIGDCSETWIGSRVVGGTWRPNFGASILGGDARLTVSATVHGQRLTAPVNRLYIRGTNPGAAAITARVGGAGAIQDRIACRESHRKQFTAAGMPLLGPGGDTGVMQLCSPAATCRQRWDWTANVDRGLALFELKRAAARRYLDAHKPGGHYPNSLGLTDAQVLMREAVKRYNQGHYWEWNNGTNRWEVRPNPANNYVAHVLGCA